ncbi:MAG: aspartate carbamoyltransferase regulatory subunit [Treponema sp.]|jgi:aspartate carbamoyltransferase regulatory subunit|uniref:aspartate carbamoyltransferase regulatory subunit n=1 Tax=Treponema sp. TaxID=166 RepID=UPI002A90AD4C|nr:aspartate carbamoyltransferase regulatory subunit [Treponema sp.]MDY6396659.1 aspartate carbamoyltransferase regulatory subunit [Treponema sp.]
MLNVDTIKNGLVIDHIKAGFGPQIFHFLGLDKADFSCALIMNVASKKTGKKDIIKIDNIINIDYSVLGFIDPNISINVIKDEKIVRKIKMELPEKVENVIRCKNPRCITVTEHYVTPSFRLVNREKAQYACEYCDALYSAGSID